MSRHRQMTGFRLSICLAGPLVKLGCCAMAGDTSSATVTPGSGGFIVFIFDSRIMAVGVGSVSGSNTGCVSSF